MEMKKRTSVVIVGVAVLALPGLVLIMRAMRPGPQPRPIVNGMTRAELLAIRGKPSYARDAQLPEHVSLGVPAPYNSTRLAPGQKYEQWLYRQETSDLLVWFSHPSALKTNWVVIGQAAVSRIHPN
jgi:hypothetical protein